jgi:hypothetical protein
MERRAIFVTAFGLVLALLFGAAAAGAEVTQKDNLRVAVSGRLTPNALPRNGVGPSSVFLSSRISTSDESDPPQLKRLRIEVNRHGRLSYRGLPSCPLTLIQPASTSRALAACRSSLVGRGHYWANVVLSGQQPYPTQGTLLIFNGMRNGKPALLGQIYSARPFATSFVIPFTIGRIAHGAYGTALTAQLPRALGSWGYITAIELKLSRRYSYRGRSQSFISASCPAPGGSPRAVFPLARTSFVFAQGLTLRSTLIRSCRVRA